MSPATLLQKIQDSQGFIVIWAYGERTIGQIIPGLAGGPHGDLEHPTVVIDTATEDEFEDQRRRFNLSLKVLDGLYFYKVKAE